MAEGAEHAFTVTVLGSHDLARPRLSVAVHCTWKPPDVMSDTCANTNAHGKEVTEGETETKRSEASTNTRKRPVEKQTHDQIDRSSEGLPGSRRTLEMLACRSPCRSWGPWRLQW